MIDIAAYGEKLGIALLQKSNQKFSRNISTELSKPEWQQQLFDLERLLSNIKDEQDFQKYERTLAELFEDIYEVITAPGVDEFIGWVNDVTDNKNNTNAKKLRDYLVENFSENNISEYIERIVNNKDVLKIDNSIFSATLNGVSGEFKRELNDLLIDPKQFENKIDNFFDRITSTFEGLKEIAELSFTTLDELFSVEQRLNNIGFYENIIKAILEKGQSLKPQNELEKSSDTLTRAKNRVSDVNKCISLLDKTRIANSNDELQKSLFLKFDKELKYDKGILNSLMEFLEKTWAEIEDHYITVKSFFSDKQSVTYLQIWDCFPKKDSINSLILLSASISADNPLDSISSKQTDDIPSILKKKAVSIEKYSAQVEQIKTELEEEFRSLIEEYQESNKVQLIENLSSNNEVLQRIKADINSNIVGLKGGIQRLKEREDIIVFLKDDFTYVLNNYNDIRSGFEAFLQESGMSPHLNWLESKLNGSVIGAIVSQDLNDPTIIKELLDKGLIKIEIAKTF